MLFPYHYRPNCFCLKKIFPLWILLLCSCSQLSNKEATNEFVIAFGGCAGYVPWHERIWDVIAGCHPHAFLWMGDNVYINVPENPGKVWVAYEFGRAFLRLRGRKPEDLLSLPEMTDKKQELAIRLIMNTISTAYLINQELFEFLCLKGFNLTLKYGVTESSPFMLNSYAFALADNFGAYKSAYDFSKTAFIMNEKFPNAQMRSKTASLFGFFFSHWCKPLKEGADMVKKGFNFCVETGDLVFAGYSACTLFIYMLVQGKNIDEILTETEIYQDFARRSGDQFSIDWYILKSLFIKGLKGQTKERCSMSDNEFDEERAVQDYKEQHNANLLFHYYTWKGMLLYLHNEMDESCRMFSEAEQYSHGVAPEGCILT